METITDDKGKTVKRIIRTADGWEIHQVPQVDSYGEQYWWNIRVERVRG